MQQVGDPYRRDNEVVNYLLTSQQGDGNKLLILLQIIFTCTSYYYIVDGALPTILRSLIATPTATLLPLLHTYPWYHSGISSDASTIITNCVKALPVMGHAPRSVHRPHTQEPSVAVT